MSQTIHFTVNGQDVEVDVEPRKTLLAVLRDRLQLTGTKEGCSTGDCGACTVIMNGKTVTSCLVLAVEANGAEITTIEGIAKDGDLHPVQAEMVKHGGLQCGFCTAGIIVSAVALLEEKPNPTDDDIRHGLAGNLCRCTGYTKVISAVRDAAKTLRRRKPSRKA